MKLLVSTPHKLILVDSRSGFQTIVESHRTEYYGISWSPDGRTLCLGHSDVENSSLLTTDSYMDSERGWLSYGSMTGPPCLSQAHQILCDGDRVIATNTGRNCITVFRTDDWFYRNYWFDEVLWDRKGKNKCGQHLNSLFLYKGQLWVVAHNHDRKSDVICCDWPSLALIRRVSTQALMAHNIWITPASQIVICDSMRQISPTDAMGPWDSITNPIICVTRPRFCTRRVSDKRERAWAKPLAALEGSTVSEAIMNQRLRARVVRAFRGGHL